MVWLIFCAVHAALFLSLSLSSSLSFYFFFRMLFLLQFRTLSSLAIKQKSKWRSLKLECAEMYSGKRTIFALTYPNEYIFQQLYKEQRCRSNRMELSRWFSVHVVVDFLFFSMLPFIFHFQPMHKKTHQTISRQSFSKWFTTAATFCTVCFAILSKYRFSLKIQNSRWLFSTFFSQLFRNVCHLCPSYAQTVAIVYKSMIFL